MRPAVVLTIAVLLLAILGAAALQFVVLAPSGDGDPDAERGLSPLVVVVPLDSPSLVAESA